MKKLITVCQALVIAAVISSLAFGPNVSSAWIWDISDESIQPEMLEAGGTVGDNTKFYRYDGTWQTVTAAPGGIEDNSITNTLINSAAAIDATKIGAGGVTSTEFGYIGTLTSDAQTQINTKAPSASPTFTGVVTIPTPYTLGAISITATGTEINYLIGVTSAIQTQLGLKAPLASPTFTGTVTVNGPNGIVSDNVSITGGSIIGITDLAVADGGTGASTAATARTSLGTDNASNIDKGVLAKSQGGFGDTVANSSGIPYFSSGTISWKTVTQFLALVGITFNAADNTWAFLAPPTITGNLTVTGEVIAQQYSTTCADNECFIQASNTGRPPVPATDNAGIFHFNATDNVLEVTNSLGAWGTVAVSW
jgi:hypothetical protein